MFPHLKPTPLVELPYPSPQYSKRIPKIIQKAAFLLC